MLELRPNCEWCDRDLPPEDLSARICSYECTYCSRCVETVLRNVCPTCGGGFAPRPIRPHREWRAGSRLGLMHDPAGSQRHHSRWAASAISEMIARVGDLEPEER